MYLLDLDLDNTHGIDLDSWYNIVIGKDSWHRHVPMVLTSTHSIDNTHGIDLDSWYRIGAPESQTYETYEAWLKKLRLFTL